jgi:EamA domain-containing membrane protein RarD
MSSNGYPWLCLLLAVLFAALFSLRRRFPAASRAAETAALMVAAVIFLSVCSLFSLPRW